MQPDPKHIQSLRTALLAGTIRAAADQLGLEPSTVSRNISALEKQFATPMIERGRRGVKPTQAGALLMEFVQRQAGELEVLRSQLDELANMERGTLSIALGEGFVGDFVHTALAQFSKDHPKITYALDVGATDHVRAAVTNDQAHLGLAFNAAPDPRLKVISQTTRALAVICRAGGPFDTPRDVTIEELSTLPFGFLSKGYGVGAVIADMEASHGFRARAVMETGSIAALKAFVRHDLGVTLLPEFVVAEEVKAGLLRARAVSVPDFGLGTVTLCARQGRRLPLAAQKLIPIMSRSLMSLND